MSNNLERIFHGINPTKFIVVCSNNSKKHLMKCEECININQVNIGYEYGSIEYTSLKYLKLNFYNIDMFPIKTCILISDKTTWYEIESTMKHHTLSSDSIKEISNSSIKDNMKVEKNGMYMHPNNLLSE